MVSAYTRRGAAYMFRGERDRAIADLDRAITDLTEAHRLDDQKPDVRKLLSLAYQSRSDVLLEDS